MNGENVDVVFVFDTFTGPMEMVVPGKPFQMDKRRIILKTHTGEDSCPALIKII